MPHRLHVPRAGQFEASEAELGDPVNFLYRGIDVAVGQTGETDLAIGVMAAKSLQPIIVDAQHLVGRFVVPHPRGHPENAEDDLGVNSVAVHVLNPLIGIARTAHAFLAVFIPIETRLGHLVDAVVLAGDELAADRTDAADQPHVDAGFGGPARPVGTILHIGHAVPQFPLCLRDKQFRRKPRQIEMTIRRDSSVLHGPVPPLPELPRL